jgi:predicted metal-dependent phosphoesterase TrpH
MRIDLHAHSTASDGTTPPAELPRLAAAAGLDVVALTDHDTTAGWAEAAAALPAGLTLVPGVELSCRWGSPTDAIEMHMLGYLFDPGHAGFAAERAAARTARIERAERMVAALAADGVPVTWERVAALAGGAPVGRPHLARALVEAGVVPDVPAAFADEWLGLRYRLPKRETDAFDAVRLVREAGGVAVFAHARARMRGRTVPDSAIAALAEAGMAGLEVDHPDHGERDRAELRGLAADLGLVVTGSSDFHGTNKPVRLGAHTTPADAYERIVALSGREPVRADMP